MKRIYDAVAIQREAHRRRKKALSLFKSGKKVGEIADMWGISKQRVSEILSRARIDAGVPITSARQGTASQRALAIVAEARSKKIHSGE